MTLREQVSSEKCACVRCSFCGGSGQEWYSISGKFLGGRHSDDLDASEPCEECGGTGIVETCDRCTLLTDLDHEDEEIAGRSRAGR